MTKLTQIKQKITEAWSNKSKRNILLLSILLIISVGLNLVYATHLRIENHYTSKYSGRYQKGDMHSYEGYGRHHTFGNPDRQVFISTVDNSGFKVYQAGNNQMPVTQMSQEEAAQVLELMDEQERRMIEMWQEHERMMNAFKTRFAF